MKFDFVIGNPPYQIETAIKETENGQKRRKSIFQYFQKSCDEISRSGSALIYPAVRWIQQSGKGMDDFGKANINDPHLKKLIVYADAKDVFDETDIADGISIVIKNKNKTTNCFEYLYKKDAQEFCSVCQSPKNDIMLLNPNDNSIMGKIDFFVSNNKFLYLYDSILSQKLFGIESDFVEKNPDKIRLLDDRCFDKNKEIKLLTNDKAGKAGRAKWFIVAKNLIPSHQDLISEWQVVVSSANAGGQKRDNQLEIIDNYSAFGRSRVALKSFKTQEEAENFYKYVKSYIIRYTFLMTDENLTSLAKKVPDILNYKSNNNIIDFSKDVDKQLCHQIQLTDEELIYIKNRVNSVRHESNK